MGKFVVIARMVGDSQVYGMCSSELDNLVEFDSIEQAEAWIAGFDKPDDTDEDSVRDFQIVELKI